MLVDGQPVGPAEAQPGSLRATFGHCSSVCCFGSSITRQRAARPQHTRSLRSLTGSNLTRVPRSRRLPARSPVPTAQNSVSTLLAKTGRRISGGHVGAQSYRGERLTVKSLDFPLVISCFSASVMDVKWWSVLPPPPGPWTADVAWRPGRSTGT